MRSQYHSLYLLKAIGVLFVLMIHFSCYKIQYFEPLYRCGVPLFYIISGFFLYAKDESVQIQKVKRSIVKIVKLILFFNIVYYLLYWTIDGKSKINTVDNIIRLVIYGDSVSGHLWFLTSYLWTLVLICIHKHFKIKDVILYIAATACLIEGLMEGQYSFAAFANSNFSIQEYYLPWLTSSLPMMAIGYVIKKHETQIVILANKHRTILSIGTIILCLFPYIEHQLLCATHHYSGTFMISTFSAVVAMFIYCICDPTMGGGKMLHITTVGKLHSDNIYYWQFFPYYLFITNMIPKDILQNVELPIMVVVLLIWSYGINWSMNLLTKHRLQQ